MSQTVAATVVLEPAAREFAAIAAQPPQLFQLGPDHGREKLNEIQAGDVPKPDVDIQDLVVPGGALGHVPIRIVRPKNGPATLPVILYLHGAGWVFGNSHTHDRLIRELAIRANAAVVFPEYSRSPEAKYPVALEECYAASRWVVEHGAEHSLDGLRMAVAGDSVGGNLATAVTLLAKERGGPRFVEQVLFYPVTDATFDTDSYRQFAEGYHLTRDAMMWFWDQYTTDPRERAQITAAPLRAAVDQLRDLPPAMVITGEADVLRDEGEAYANKLREAGVPVIAVRYQGIIHDFVMLNALADTNAARNAIAQAGAGLRASLHRA